ncbi:hypothetical protein L6164_003960 [Bauhinia variegata]|uniref:Uncharacterized protein n=1 Tax=Bauhinia variegata TaxID=167791 RepID=A0ACB9Q2Z5_BAUVA|nr:hypothetical protein L6164_003960 [Bauhinia variegata]
MNSVNSSESPSPPKIRTLQQPSENSTVGMDFISELPDHILHMLLWDLPRKDAARTCVLSKAWRAINYSSPFLNFDERHFLPKRNHSVTTTNDSIFSGDFNYAVVAGGVSILHPRRQKNLKEEEQTAIKECHDLFMNYIETRMLQHDKSIEQFDLTILNFNHERDSSRLDLWLKHAFERRVSKLILTVFTSLFEEQKEEEVVYSLPCSFFVSETLTELKLANCKLTEYAAGGIGNIKLPRLRHIYLSNLDLEDDFFKCLIFGCPLLEAIVVSFCSKLTIFQVTSLLRLERVVIRSCSHLENLILESPKLQYFQFYGCYSNVVRKSCKLVSFLTSNVIKQMVLGMVGIPGTWIQTQVVKCEELRIIEAGGLENTKLSSQKLRYLTIQHFRNEEVIEIDCPNLYSLNYFDNWSPSHYVNPSELRRIIFELSLEDYEQQAPLSDKLKQYFGDCNVIEKLIKQLIIYSKDHEDVIILDGLIYESTSFVHVLSEVKAIMPKAKLIISSLDVEDLVDHFCANSRNNNTPRQALNIISTQESNSNFSQVLAC